MKRRLVLISLAAVAISACRKGEPAPAADPTQARQPAPQLRLTRADGQVFDLAEQRGKIVVVFFGYTHCPDYCPTTMADFKSVKRRLGMRAETVRFVFVSVDPARDTPERTQAYANGFDRSFIGLSGDSASLAGIQRDFHVASFIERDSTADYTVGHSALVFIVGRDGQVASTILPGDGRAEWLLNSLNELLNK